MHRRTWDAETKTKIVLQGLQGRPTAELCHEYRMSPSLYDQWRDQFLANASRAFDVQPCHRKETRLLRENTRLKRLTVTDLSAVAEEKPGTSAVPLRPGPPAQSKPQPPAQSKTRTSLFDAIHNSLRQVMWIHFVDTPNGILYYNVHTSAGAVGRIDSASNHTTIKEVLHDGSFSASEYGAMYE
jgi:transposase-like protein